MAIEYRHESCRLVKKLRKMLEEYAASGWKLKSVTMGDMMTRYELVFEKCASGTQEYIYAHECCRRKKKLNRLLADYAASGWELAFQIMSDMGTRYDAIFVKSK